MVREFQSGMQRADTAGDVKADAAGRHDAAIVRIECGNPADRKTVSPMGVGHRINGAREARQQCDVTQLRVDLVVHL